MDEEERQLGEKKMKELIDKYGYDEVLKIVKSTRTAHFWK